MRLLSCLFVNDITQKTIGRVFVEFGELTEGGVELID